MSVGQGLAAFISAGVAALALTTTLPADQKPAGWSADVVARNWLIHRRAAIAQIQAQSGMTGLVDPGPALPADYAALYGWSTVSQAVPGGRLAVSIVSPAVYSGSITELAAQAARLARGDHGIGITRAQGETIIGPLSPSNVPTPAGVLPGALVAVTFLRDPS